MIRITPLAINAVKNGLMGESPLISMSTEALYGPPAPSTLNARERERGPGQPTDGPGCQPTGGQR
ncbi:hypothetical protein GCM10010336_70630 [Streptomyces goshikiensis]|nr:hypothetical protein GCM10010336_70630 [Streptomyces goshikiensis]